MSVKLREKKLSKGISYYLDIYHEGQRYYETLFKVLPNDDKKAKKELAQVIRNKRELELFNNSFEVRPNKTSKISIYQYLDDYLSTYNKKDINTMRASITQFKQFHKDFPLLKINPVIIENFYIFLEDSNFKGDTPRSYYRRIKKALNNAVKLNLIDSNVLIQVRIKHRGLESNATLKKNILTELELEMLHETECGNNAVKKAFLFSTFTGLGYAEITDLRPSNIINGRLIVLRKKTGTQVNIKLSKKALILINTHDTYCFDLINPLTKRFYSETGVNKVIQNWVQRAEINKKITYYCARHTFAVRLLNNGANIKTVSDALGHKSLDNTYKYLNHIDNIKDEVTENL